MTDDTQPYPDPFNDLLPSALVQALQTVPYARRYKLMRIYHYGHTIVIGDTAYTRRGSEHCSEPYDAEAERKAVETALGGEPITLPNVGSTQNPFATGTGRSTNSPLDFGERRDDRRHHSQS